MQQGFSVAMGRCMLCGEGVFAQCENMFGFRVHAFRLCTTYLLKFENLIWCQCINTEPGLYDPRRKLELRGDQEFVIPCGQKFRDVDPGCYKSSIEYILEQRKEAALSELKEEIAQNIKQRVRTTVEHTELKKKG